MSEESRRASTHISTNDAFEIVDRISTYLGDTYSNTIRKNLVRIVCGMATKDEWDDDDSDLHAQKPCGKRRAIKVTTDEFREDSARFVNEAMTGNSVYILTPEGKIGMSLHSLGTDDDE